MVQHIIDRIDSVFSDLVFDEQRHLYFVKNTKLPSVSSKVEAHAEKFDINKWAPICARKEGITEHEIRHKWQTINKDACELGHETHDYLEHFNGLKTPSTPQEKAGVKFLTDHLGEYEIIKREIRMYSKRYKYAGTADLLLRHIGTGDFILADYKTNRDLFKSYNFLLPPFQYLECHPYNKYQLQLSYYQILLEDVAIPIKKRLIIHLKADETYRIFEGVDFTSQLREHLESKKESLYETR